LPLLLLATPALAQSGGFTIPSGGGGGTPCTSTASSLQYDAAGSFGCVSGWTSNGTTQVTSTLAPAANTATASLIFTDTTTASSGNQQYSPCAQFTGQGWKTTATAGSEEVDWQVCNVPVQGATAPSTNLNFYSQVNNGGYVLNGTINSSGQFIGQYTSYGVPVFAFSTSTTSGLGYNGSGVELIVNGSPVLNVVPNSIEINQTAYLTSITAAILQLGQPNAVSPVNQTLQAQGVIVGTTSNGTGGNLLIQPGVSTGNATTSQLNFNTWVPVGSGTATQTQTLTLQLAGGAVSMPSLAASSAATTGTVCWTTGGNLTVDTTLACLASLEELKDIHGPIINAVTEVLSLEPFSFAWKEGTNQRAGDTQEQLGLGAHQVAAIDKRLVSYSDDGKLLGVRYQEMTALLVQAIKEQQAEIEELKRAR
jgi:hypothetical protein